MARDLRIDSLSDLGVHETWDTWGSFVSACEHPTDLPERRQSSRNSGRESFSGAASWEETARLARTGWPEGHADVQAALADLSTHLGTVDVATVEPARVGGRPLVGRAVRGHPASMARLRNRTRAREAVSIVVNCCFSSGVSKERITQRGAAAVALVEALTSNGLAVDLTVIMANKGRAGVSGAVVEAQVVTPGETVDKDLIAFAVAHPAVLRRMMFARMERWDADKRDVYSVPGSYGKVAESPVHRERADVYLPGGTLQEMDWSEDEAVADWIRDQLESQGISLGD